MFRTLHKYTDNRRDSLHIGFIQDAALVPLLKLEVDNTEKKIECCFTPNSYKDNVILYGEYLIDKYDNNIFIVHDWNKNIDLNYKDRFSFLVNWMEENYVYDIYRNDIIIEIARMFNVYELEDCMEEWIPNYSYNTLGLLVYYTENKKENKKFIEYVHRVSPSGLIKNL